MPLGTESILLVEDNELVRIYAQNQLESLGYTVIVAETSTQALDILRSQIHIDLLFTDVMMPGLSGPRLVEAAEVLRPNLKVVYTSGYTENAIMQQGRPGRNVQLLSKPYCRADVARTLRAVLDAPKPM